MAVLLGFSRAIDMLNTWLGRACSWLLLITVIISATNAVVRKLFDTSSNAWLELQWVLFGAVFLICASWTMIANEHIRIDIINNLLKRRTRNWIDVIGHLFFLIPVAAVMVYTSIPFVLTSIAQNEQSSNAGGLPVYPAKALVLIGFTLLLLQGFSELIKRVAIMKGLLKDTGTGGGHHASAAAEAERLRETLAEEARKREADGLSRN